VSATTRRTLAAVLAALVLGGTMAVLGLVGDDRRGGGPPDPDFPALADAPLPGAAGEVALLRDQAVPCASVVDMASGEVRDLRCERDLAGPPTWTAEGDVEVRRRTADEAEVLVLDPDDGEVRDRRLVPGGALRDPPDAHEAPGRRIAEDGRRLVVGSDEDSTWLEVVSAAGATDRVLDAPTGGWAGFTSASWSPDDRFALVEGRNAVYLVDPSTGEARVLALRARDAVWQPVP
jgi:hypothetical protein